MVDGETEGDEGELAASACWNVVGEVEGLMASAVKDRGKVLGYGCEG